MNSRHQFASAGGTGLAAALDQDTAWKQVLARDADAAFIYAVTTTGVFCKPGCGSRRPRRENVQFFGSAEAAQAAGYRACKRCISAGGGSLDKVRGGLDRARAHLEAHTDRPVRLAELGRVAGLSPFTVQRLFKQRLGVSPLQYQRALRAGNLRVALRKGGSVTDAIYAVGFGSSSRAYEGAPLGMTPARFAQGGKGERIGFTTARTPFGWMIVGATERGLCWLALGATSAEAEASLREEFPAAELRRDSSLRRLVDAALESVREGQRPWPRREARPMPWICAEPYFNCGCGRLCGRFRAARRARYGQLAREMGIPTSTRAVARACATNRVALLVPCHRVVGASGSPTGYRWGVERKVALLEAERR